MTTENGDLLVKLTNPDDISSSGGSSETLISSNVSIGKSLMHVTTNNTHDIFPLSATLYKFKGHVSANSFTASIYHHLEIYDGTAWNLIKYVASGDDYVSHFEFFGYGLRVAHATDQNVYYSVARSTKF